MGRVTGSLVVVQRKGGPVYFIKARDRDGRQIKKRLGPVEDWPRKRAEDALRDYLTDLGRVPLQGEAVSFRYAAQAWLSYVEQDRARKPSTLRDYTNTVNRHLISRLGDRPISEITGEDLDRLRGELLGELSRRTTQKILVIAHGIFALATRRGWVTANPLAAVEKVTVAKRTEFAVLSPPEVLKVARHAGTDWQRVAIITAAFTGLRLGELRALRWRDVDFAQNLVHVRRAHFGGTGGVEGTPKGGTARSVPLIDLAAAELDRLSRRERFTAPADRVFCDQAGRPCSDGSLRSALYDAMKAARVDRDRGTGKLFVFHDLRHTFGTLAVRAYPLSDVQAYMGHADIQTTMIYVHHQSRARAAAQLGAVVAGELESIEAAISRPAGTRTMHIELEDLA